MLAILCTSILVSFALVRLFLNVAYNKRPFPEGLQKGRAVDAASDFGFTMLLYWGAGLFG